MKPSIYSKDIVLILAASFCFMASPMLVTPLITGFSGSIGAPAALMGLIGGLTNLSRYIGVLLLLSALYELAARTVWKQAQWREAY